MSTDPMLDKIRKLLALAENDGATPAEAEAFTAKATELIAKYGIDRALLAATDADSDRPGDRVIDVDAPFARDKVSLLVSVSQALRCQHVMRKRYVGGRPQLSVHLFGYASDLERTELLYTSLLVQAAHGLAHVPWHEDNKAAYRRSWLAGFTQAIYWRLVKAEQRARHNAEQDATGAGSTAGPSVALVLADRSAVIKRAVDDAYPNLKTARPRKLSGGGRHDGYAAGQRADLGGTSVGRSGRPAVGR